MNLSLVDIPKFIYTTEHTVIEFNRLLLYHLLIDTICLRNSLYFLLFTL